MWDDGRLTWFGILFSTMGGIGGQFVDGNCNNLYTLKVRLIAVGRGPTAVHTAGQPLNAQKRHPESSATGNKLIALHLGGPGWAFQLAWSLSVHHEITGQLAGRKKRSTSLPSVEMARMRRKQSSVDCGSTSIESLGSAFS